MKSLSRVHIISILSCVLLIMGGAESGSRAQERSRLQEAATLFALGSYEAAEEAIRSFLAGNPSAEDLDRAIELLTEIRIEKEGERMDAGTMAPISAGTTNIAPEVFASTAKPAETAWSRSFPGAPDQYRKDATVYAISADGRGEQTTIKIHRSGASDFAMQRQGLLLIIDLPELTDGLPAGGVELPSGGALSIRHSQHSMEPLVTRIVVQLRAKGVRADVTSGDDAIVIAVEDEAVAPSMTTAGTYRPPVATSDYRVDIVGGNFQSGAVADRLPEPLAVRVIDPKTGMARGDVPVQFYSVDAGIVLSSPSTRTTAEGIALSSVVLDQVAGRKVIAARVPETKAEASFEVYGLPRAPDSIRKIDISEISVRTRENSTTPLVVSVQDVYGNPVPGVEVKWSFVSGDGRLDVDPAVQGDQMVAATNEKGTASLRNWSTGPQPGVQRIQALFTAGSISRFTQFEIEVEPQLVNLDFATTPVPDILRFLGRIANWNLILSDGVLAVPPEASEITVHLENTPIDEALDKILQMKNLTRVDQSDGSIKILTFVEAQTAGQSIVTDDALLDNLSQDAVKTVILEIPGDNFSAMVGALTPLLTSEGKVVQDPSSQKIVVTDYVSVTRRMRDVLRELVAGNHWQVLTYQRLNFGDENFKAFVTRLIPAEIKSYFTGRSIILIGASGTIDRVDRILKTLDEDEELMFADQAAVGKQFELFFLKSRKAAELAPILTGVLLDNEAKSLLTSAALHGKSKVANEKDAGGRVQESGIDEQAMDKAYQAISGQVKIVPEPELNALIIYGAPSDLEIVGRIVGRLDTLASENKGWRILTFEHLNLNSALFAAFIKEQVTRNLESFFSGRAAILMGPKEALDTAESILKKLDEDKDLEQSIAGENQFEIVPLRAQKATDMVTLLKEIFQYTATNDFLTGIEQKTGDGVAAAETYAAASGAAEVIYQQITGEVKFVPENRTNVIILTGKASDLQIVKKVIQRLDSLNLQKENLTMNDIKVHQVKYRQAAEVLDMIQRIMLPETESKERQEERERRSYYWWDNWYDRGAGRQIDTARGAADEDTSTIQLRLFSMPEPNLIIVVGGSDKERQMIVDMIEEFDNAVTREGNYLQVYELKHILPSEFLKFVDKTILENGRADIDWYSWWYFYRNRGSGDVRKFAIDSLGLILIWARIDVHNSINDLKKLVDRPEYENRLDLVTKTYAVSQGDIYAIAEILTRNALNQGEDEDEFLYVVEAQRSITIWAKESTHTKVERLLPQFDKLELKFDPLLKYSIYEFKNISVTEVMGVQSSLAASKIKVTGGEGATAAGPTKTILQLISEPLGEGTGRGIYPSVTGNFILVWGPTGNVDRTLEFARQIDRRWEQSRVEIRTYTIAEGNPTTVMNFIKNTIFGEGSPTSRAEVKAQATEFLLQDPVDPAVLHVWALPSTHDRILTFMEIIDTKAFNYDNYRVFRIPGLDEKGSLAFLRGVAPSAQVFNVGDLWVAIADLGSLQRIEEVVKAVTRPDTEPLTIDYLQLTRLKVDAVIPILAVRFGVTIEGKQGNVFFIDSEKDQKYYEEFRTAQRTRPPITVLVLQKENLFVMLGDEHYVSEAIKFVRELEDATTGKPRVVTLQYITTGAFAGIVQEIYPNIRMFDIARNNAIVVMESEGADKLNALQALIDVKPFREEGLDLYSLFRLKNRTAGEVAATISSLLGLGQSGFSSITGGAGRASLTAEEGQSNVPLSVLPVNDANVLIFAGGNLGQRKLATTLAGELDAEPFQTGNFFVRLYNFKYILPTEFDKFLTTTIIKEETKKTVKEDEENPGKKTTTTEKTTDARRIPIDSLKILMVSTSRPIHQQIEDLINLVDTSTFAQKLELRAKAYKIENADLDAVANIIERTALNQTEGAREEFFLVNRENRELIVWAKEGAHVKIERILPTYDRAELSYDPGLRYEVYTFQNISTNMMMNNTASGFTTTGPTLFNNLQDALKPTGTVFLSGVGNFAFMYGPSSNVERALTFCRQIDATWAKVMDGHYEMIPLRYNVPSQLIPKITRLMAGHLLEMVAMDDRGVIMVVTPPEILDRVRQLVLDFDTAIPTAFYTPTHMDIAEIATSLSNIFAPSGATSSNFLIEQFQVPGGRGVSMIRLRGSQKLIDEALRMAKEIDSEIDFVLYHGIIQHPTGDLNNLVMNLFPQLYASPINVAGTGEEWMFIKGPKHLLKEALKLCDTIDTLGYFDVYEPKFMGLAEAQGAIAQFFPHMDFIPVGASRLFVQGRRDGVVSAIKLLAELDTEMPFQVFRSSHLHAISDIQNMIREMFPSVTQIGVGSSGGGGFEQVIVRGPATTLAMISRMWDAVDTAGTTEIYRPKHRTADEIQGVMQAYMVHIGLTLVSAPPTSAGAVTDMIILQGEQARVNEAIKFIRKIDVAENVRVLQYGRLSVTDAATLVRSFYPNISLEVIAANSILLARGAEEQVDAAEAMLSQLEESLHWRIWPLSRVDPQTVITTLNTLFGSVQATPLPAGNGLALIASEARMAEVTAFLRKLEASEIHMIPVTASDPTTVLAAVTQFFPGVDVNAAAINNNLVLTADKSVADEIRKFVKSIDKTVHTAIRPLRHFDPTVTGELTSLQTTLLNYLSASGTIFFDNQSNAFVMTAPLDNLEDALKVLDDLDRPAPQFLVEVVIAEINQSDIKQLGISWQLRPDLTEFSLPPPFPVPTPASGASDVTFASSGNFSVGIGRNNFAATLSALLQTTDARVISSPKIITRNNVRGSISVNQNLPYTVTTFNAQGIPATTTNFQDIPITLTVTPTSIEGSDNIRMTVEATISVIASPVVGGQAAATNQRTVTTTVEMKDGGTIIIGGLMSTNENEVMNKVPILGDIPGIGALFRNKTRNLTNTEVLIFLTPRILYKEAYELQMEEELNRFKYLVNFPADWSGRRWLINNPREGEKYREKKRDEKSNFIIRSESLDQPPAPSTEMSKPAEITRAPSSEDVAKLPKASLLGTMSSIDVNAATAAQLKALPGMPAHVAELIVRYREANGAFKRVRDIINVPGVTTELVDEVGPYLRVTPDGSPVSSMIKEAPRTEPAPTVSTPTAPAAPMAPAPMATSSITVTEPTAPKEVWPTERININTATVNDFVRIPGLSENTARMIIAYRNTYGSFSVIDDLVDVPGITPDYFAKIRNVITVSSASVAPAAPVALAAPVQPMAAPAALPAPTAAPIPVPAPASKVNINSAGLGELMALPGMDEGKARMVIAYRNSYGSFQIVDELLDVPGMTPDVFGGLRDMISVDGGAGPASTAAPAAPATPQWTPSPPPPAPPAANLLNINTASEVELSSIKEFSSQNVKLILAYRASYGAFASVDDLLQVPSINKELLDKVRARLSVK